MNSKTVVVTGAGRGIGKAIAVSFAKENYNVVVNSRNPQNASSVAEEIISLGTNAVGVGVMFPKKMIVRILLKLR